LWWPPILLLAFIAFQVIPIPPAWLQILSPVRAKLLESVNGVSPGNAYAPISLFPSGSIAELLRLGAYFVVFVLTRELAWKTRRRRWVIVTPIVVIATEEAAMGLLQYDPLAGSYARGTYANQNHFAGFLEMSLPFAIVYPIAAMKAQRNGSLRQMVLPSICIAAATLILIGIILSMSRMAFVATLASVFLAGMLVPVAAGTTLSRWLTALILLATMTVMAFAYLAPDTLIRRFSQVLATEGVPADVRIHLWSDTRRLAADYPLVGSGLGTFEQAFVRYKTLEPQIAIDSAHNDYLQLLVELGAAGFAAAVMAMGSLLFSAVRTVYKGTDPTVRYIAIACLSALVAILIHSFTDFNLYIPANGMLVAWIAGVIGSLSFSSPKLVEERLMRAEKTQSS
jgi:O-antigen ligase